MNSAWLTAKLNVASQDTGAQLSSLAQVNDVYKMSLLPWKPMVLLGSLMLWGGRRSFQLPFCPVFTHWNFRGEAVCSFLLTPCKSWNPFFPPSSSPELNGATDCFLGEKTHLMWAVCFWQSTHIPQHLECPVWVLENWKMFYVPWEFIGFHPTEIACWWNVFHCWSVNSQAWQPSG